MYETDLTNSQWQVMQHVLPVARRRKYSLRLVVNALLCLTKSGCPWRLLPNDFPPHPICFYYFRRWLASGQWARLNQVLVEHERQRSAPSGHASPRGAVVDAQSVKCSERGVPDKGFDGHKQVQGRKRQLAVDTPPASGGPVLEKLRHQEFAWLKLVFTDVSYDGRPLAEWVRAHCGWRLETAPACAAAAALSPSPRAGSSSVPSVGCTGTGA